MSKRTRSLALGALGALLVTAAAAPEAHAARFYLAGDVGWTFLVGNDKFDNDLNYGGGIGIDFDGPALELTATYGSFDVSQQNVPFQGGTEDLSGKMNVLSLGLSGRYNIDMSFARLYFLVGGAYHVVDFKSSDTIAGNADQFKSDQNQWGLIAGGGLEFKLGDHLAVGPDVRYNLIFSNNFSTVDQIKNTDFANYPDFLYITGRATVYF